MDANAWTQLLFIQHDERIQPEEKEGPTLQEITEERTEQKTC